MGTLCHLPLFHCTGVDGKPSSNSPDGPEFVSLMVLTMPELAGLNARVRKAYFSPQLLTLPSTPWSREPPCLLGSPGSGAERQRFRGCPSLASGKRRAVPGNPRGRARRGPAAPLGASRPATATSRPPSAPAGPGGARSRWHRCGPAGRLSPRGVRVCARVCVRVCVCVCVCPPRGGGDFTSARRWLRQDWKV